MNAKRALATVAILLALSSCGSTPPLAPQASSAVAGVKTPRPTVAQGKDLLSKLKPLAPKIAEERIIDKGRWVCASIIKKDSAADVAKTASKHFADEADPVTADEATRIVAVVRGNGFCK